MNGTLGTDGTATADDSGGLDPRQAVALLDQTNRQAQQQFDVSTPLLWLIRAAVCLCGYGAIWLAVRGQHPYKGPNGAILAIVYALVIIVVVASARVFQRATTGVSGPSTRRRRAYLAAFVSADIAAYVFMGALLHDGASRPVVYGVFAAAGPPLILGAAIAAAAAARENWPLLGVGLAVIATAALGAYAGPAGSWGIIAVGGCAALLCQAAVQAWLQRR